MAYDELERLLNRRDGSPDPADVDAVRALLLRYEREFPLPLGAALRDEAGEVDVTDVVGAMLQPGDGFMLQPGDGIIGFADALRDEAGEVDLAGDVLAAIMGTMPVARAVRTELRNDVPVADAVRAEAGSVEVAGEVLDEAGLREPYVPVAEAVRAEAGTVDVVDAVMSALGVRSLAIGEAIRAEAGTVDVTDPVMTGIAPASVEAAAPVIPAAANRGWTWGALAVAAAAAIVIGADVWFAGGTEAPTQTTLASVARPDEIRIDDLSYGENANVQVITTDGEGATTMIWIDGETL